MIQNYIYKSSLSVCFCWCSIFLVCFIKIQMNKYKLWLVSGHWLVGWCLWVYVCLCLENRVEMIGTGRNQWVLLGDSLLSPGSFLFFFILQTFTFLFHKYSTKALITNIISISASTHAFVLNINFFSEWNSTCIIIHSSYDVYK